VRSIELWQPVDAWVLVVAIGIPVLGRVAIVWLAVRNAKSADLPKIISALAELFGRWRRTGSGKPQD
jgi:hypothetical protein